MVDFSSCPLETVCRTRHDTFIPGPNADQEGESVDNSLWLLSEPVPKIVMRRDFALEPLQFAVASWQRSIAEEELLSSADPRFGARQVVRFPLI